MTAEWQPREPFSVTTGLPATASVCAPDAEAELVDRARAGDPDAFDALCRWHGDRLLRQATLWCGDAGTAEDLVQETLIAAWRCLGRYHGGCRFFTWLCAILIRRHRMARRREWAARILGLRLASGGGGTSPKPAGAEVEEETGGPDDPAIRPDHRLEAAEQAAAVRASLDRLPVKLREVVVLRFYAGDSLEGIAAALGCPVGTVKSRLFHGLEALRRMKALAGERKS